MKLLAKGRDGQVYQFYSFSIKVILPELKSMILQFETSRYIESSTVKFVFLCCSSEEFNTAFIVYDIYFK